MADNLTDRAGLQAAADVRAAGFAVDARPSTQRLLLEGEARLAGCSATARLDAELLLARALGCPRSGLLAWPERTVEPDRAADFRELLVRAASGEPLAYLLGEREFWSLPLVVTSAVLVPRPETELAVERCLALCPERTALRAADLGTGSGAIALALASERPLWQLAATDCSAEALQVARLNGTRLGLERIEFLRGDWFEPLGGRRFELLVSNPPYVAADDPALVVLRHEPRLALTPGRDALQALARLIHGAPSHLQPGGWLVLEHGADQGPAVAQLLRTTGYAHICQHRDLAGHVRVSEGQWP